MKQEKDLNAFAQECLAIAEEHGFLSPNHIDQTTEILSKLMLVTTEVAEAAEAVRKGDKDNLAEELADIIIRVIHLSAGLEIDIQQELLTKIEHNRNRPYMHGKKA